MANQNHQQTVCCPSFTLLPPHSTLLLKQHPPLLFHKENEDCWMFSFLISKAHASVPPLDGLFYLSKVSWWWWWGGSPASPPSPVSSMSFFCIRTFYLLSAHYSLVSASTLLKFSGNVCQWSLHIVPHKLILMILIDILILFDIANCSILPGILSFLPSLTTYSNGSPLVFPFHSSSLILFYSSPKCPWSWGELKWSNQDSDPESRTPGPSNIGPMAIQAPRCLMAKPSSLTIKAKRVQIPTLPLTGWMLCGKLFSIFEHLFSYV